MTRWVQFPGAGEFQYTVTSLKKAWTRLHAGDCEPMPRSTGPLQAWVHFHNGDFESAVHVGLEAGGSGINAANKATCLYATHLEPCDTHRLTLYKEVAERSHALQQQDPGNVNAWYLEAHALGRYSQGISVGLALAEGLGSRVRKALDTTLKLTPHHADAHLALAAFHAEVIHKVGVLIGGLTYGAKKDAGHRHYRTAMELNPHSAATLIEYANGLVMLDGEHRRPEAITLLQRAAALTPLDAAQRLDINFATLELAN